VQVTVTDAGGRTGVQDLVITVTDVAESRPLSIALGNRNIADDAFVYGLRVNMTL